ncbi:MAG: ubiquinol-cytochrome c reductase iron-sulfur subunit [Rickettsiales bacterium]|nr:ubiquinol-cytochrome c reductase iron-sulfur subunit [Rickettsiales bacterium]OUV53208.1 MAG: ubiquinol-cytochrome c reductase iron-sulfur subunit [Rickettsiales bacterium TMED127]
MDIDKKTKKEYIGNLEKSGDVDSNKRDFLYLTTTGLAVAGGLAAGWTLIDTMNPAKDVLALSTTEVDLSLIEKGKSLTVMWRGKPVFIKHRTTDEIAQAKSVNLDDLIHKVDDDTRVIKDEWLVVLGVCTHLGCVPLGQKTGDAKGEFGGWFCPCHGSHYDTSGRIRKGPAPLNLDVPPYEFVSDDIIKIG